jgi:hypothetical protein
MFVRNYLVKSGFELSSEFSTMQFKGPKKKKLGFNEVEALTIQLK